MAMSGDETQGAKNSNSKWLFGGISAGLVALGILVAIFLSRGQIQPQTEQSSKLKSALSACNPSKSLSSQGVTLNGETFKLNFVISPREKAGASQAHIANVRCLLTAVSPKIAEQALSHSTPGGMFTDGIIHSAWSWKPESSGKAVSLEIAVTNKQPESSNKYQDPSLVAIEEGCFGGSYLDLSEKGVTFDKAGLTVDLLVSGTNPVMNQAMQQLDPTAADATTLEAICALSPLPFAKALIGTDYKGELLSNPKGSLDAGKFGSWNGMWNQDLGGGFWVKFSTSPIFKN